MTHGGSAGARHTPSHREASRTPRMIEHPCPFRIRPYSLLAQALSPSSSETGSLPRCSEVSRPRKFAGHLLCSHRHVVECV